MTDKEKLNSILRLRLFYATERELSALVGYNLRGNHFSRFKPFQCEAYFSRFAEECRLQTQGAIDLATMLHQYKATSHFFQTRIARTAYESDKSFVHPLLDHLFLGSEASKETVGGKVSDLCNQYDKANADDELNIGILLLITYGLLPTFGNKSIQDVPHIIGDFERAYALLMDIAKSHKEQANAKFREMLCLKEMRQLIEEERTGDRFLNRLLLIHITNDALRRIFAFVNPTRLKELNERLEPMALNLHGVWRCDDDAENVFWEFYRVNDMAHILYRNEIDYEQATIRYTHYQLMFKDLGYKDFCYTIIMQPVANYNNLLGRELPNDAMSSDFTQVEYDRNRTVNRLTFTVRSPLGDRPLTLVPANLSKVAVTHRSLHFYDRFVAVDGKVEGFRLVDEQAEYAVDFIPIDDVAVTSSALFFKIDGETYRLDKWDANGEETIPGISVLTHEDNFLLAHLTDRDTPRLFFCLDTINQNIDFTTLLAQPYFRPLTTITDLF
ncbi:MAG: hypothetical protein HUK01_10770 [Bacteroidaceae bacterium]|nr:hypothetical protein [Bacteroidaceae bacterium]